MYLKKVREAEEKTELADRTYEIWRGARRLEVVEKETYCCIMRNADKGVNLAEEKVFKMRVPEAALKVGLKVDMVSGRGSRKSLSMPVWNPEVMAMVIPSMMVESSAGAKVSESEKGWMEP